MPYLRAFFLRLGDFFALLNLILRFNLARITLRLLSFDLFIIEHLRNLLMNYFDYKRIKTSSFEGHFGKWG